MIAIIGLGLAFLFVLAIGVQAVDIAQAPRRRRVAAERRERWEARTRPALGGPFTITRPAHVPMEEHAMITTADRLA